MVFIPLVIESLEKDVKWHVKQCYLAEILKKKEFLGECRNFRSIDHSLVMDEIVQRVSFQVPEPEGSFPWFLVKQLIRGTLRVFLYSLELSNINADKFIKKLNNSITIPDERHNWNAFKVPEEIEDIGEILMDPEKLEHLATHDIFQIEEDFERINLDKDECDFPAFNEDELHIALSENWWTALRDRMKEGNLARCPTRRDTPKRKAPVNETGDSPPGTPSKIPRRNLEHSYEAPDLNTHESNVRDEPLAAPLEPTLEGYAEVPDDGGADVTKSPTATAAPEDGQPPPLPAAADAEAESTTAAPGDDVQLPEVSGAPDEPLPDEPLPDQPLLRDAPIRRRRPMGTVITDATLQKRLRNFLIRTVPIEERRANPRMLNNDAAVLFSQPAATWDVNGSVSSIANFNFPSMQIIPRTHEHQFNESIYETAEYLRSAEGRDSEAVGLHSQISRNDDVPPPPGAGTTINDHQVPEDNVPEPESYPPVPRVPQHEPMETDQHTDVPIPQIETEPEALSPGRTSHPHSSHSLSSTEFNPIPQRSSTPRSSERTVDTESLIHDQNHAQSEFTKETFVNILNLVFEYMAQIDDGVHSGVDFNVVMNPAICQEKEYMLALNYSMELMRERCLIMKQAAPYKPLILIPSKSWLAPDEPL